MEDARQQQQQQQQRAELMSWHPTCPPCPNDASPPPQEVTHYIYLELQQQRWWGKYTAQPMPPWPPQGPVGFTLVLCLKESVAAPCFRPRHYYKHSPTGAQGWGGAGCGTIQVEGGGWRVVQWEAEGRAEAAAAPSHCKRAVTLLCALCPP